MTPRLSEMLSCLLFCTGPLGLAQQVRNPETVAHASPHSPLALTNIEAIAGTGYVAIEISLSVPFTPHVLRLTGPDRLVFDFPGYELQTSERRIAVNSGPVQGLRLSQFQAHPAVTRVVADLKQPLDYQLSFKEDRAVIEIAVPPSTPLSAAVADDLHPDAKAGSATTAEQIGWEESKEIPADPELAQHYYETAAEQGVPKAQFLLGQLLARKGESQDNRAQAYKWLALAQSSIKESKPVLNDLKKLMSPQEVAEAEHAVDAWRKTHRELGNQP